MSIALKTIGLLILSNTFMLSAWYLHLNIPQLQKKPLIVASLLSWGIAFIEYQFHIPANRIGIGVFTLDQLQIIQVGMSLLMFIPFSMIVMKTPFRWDYIYAMVFLSIAAYFIFRPK